MLGNKLRSIPQRIEQIARDVIREYAERIYSEAISGIKGGRLRGSVRLVFSENGMRATIETDEVILAYIEFGTGDYASAYLSGKPQEMVDEAIKFYVSGKGTMPASPWLFPVYYKYKDEIPKEFDRRVQEFFNTL